MDNVEHKKAKRRSYIVWELRNLNDGSFTVHANSYRTWHIKVECYLKHAAEQAHAKKSDFAVRWLHRTNSKLEANALMRSETARLDADLRAWRAVKT